MLNTYFIFNEISKKVAKQHSLFDIPSMIQEKLPLNYFFALFLFLFFFCSPKNVIPYLKHHTRSSTRVMIILNYSYILSSPYRTAQILQTSERWPEKNINVAQFRKKTLGYVRC